MKLRLLALALLWLLAVDFAAAESIEGVVTNGTYGRPQAGAAVSLLKLDQGMEPIQETTTDAQGRFRFADVPPGLGAPYLVRVTYAKATYHAPVGFEAGPVVRADVEVYERTASEKDLAVTFHGLTFDPREGVLAVREAFLVENRIQPRQTIYRDGGTFRFALPAGAKDVELSVQGPSGMPLQQRPAEVVPGQYLLDFPLRPGSTQIRLSYTLSYANARTKLALRAYYRVGQTQVFVPSEGVEVSSETLKPLGTDSSSHMNVYGVEALPAGAALELEISGTRPATTRPAGEGANADTVGSVTIFPNAVAQARWYIVTFAFFVLVLGLYYLYLADRPAESEEAERASPAKRRRPRRATEATDDHTAARR